MQKRLLPSERWKKSSNLENIKNNLNLNQLIVFKQIILASNSELNLKQKMKTIRKLNLMRFQQFLNLANFKLTKLQKLKKSNRSLKISNRQRHKLEVCHPFRHVYQGNQERHLGHPLDHRNKSNNQTTRTNKSHQ